MCNTYFAKLLELRFMKKLRIIVLSTAALFMGVLANGQARDVSVMIDKENRQAVMININQPEGVTSDALNQRLQRSGLKAKTKRGFTKYNMVTFSEISPDQLDIYTKVKKGPGNTSIVYLAATRGYTTLTNSSADSTITANMKEYLQSFVETANRYSVDAEINNQIAAVNKEEKIYQQLFNEQADLQKKKSNIDNRLAEIQRDLRIGEEKITKMKSNLEIERSKRTNLNNQ